jgi:predicted RNA binding protein YcfA (HicA-like mRNA interferase family)
VTRLHPIVARRMIQFLKVLGFRELRHKGSHRFFLHPDGRTATVPDHRGEDLGRGIIRAILHDIEVSPSEFHRWVES